MGKLVCMIFLSICLGATYFLICLGYRLAPKNIGTVSHNTSVDQEWRSDHLPGERFRTQKPTASINVDKRPRSASWVLLINLATGFGIGFFVGGFCILVGKVILSKMSEASSETQQDAAQIKNTKYECQQPVDLVDQPYNNESEGSRSQITSGKLSISSPTESDGPSLKSKSKSAGAHISLIKSSDQFDEEDRSLVSQLVNVFSNSEAISASLQSSDY